MKTGIILFFLLISILFLQNINPTKTGGMIALADTSAFNPNGSSELSLLMREMQQFTNTAKKSIENNTVPESYPAQFDNIYYAAISEGMSKSDFYNNFADLYITAVKNYSNSSPEERIQTYNNMVSACLACHTQHCPGPVSVIKKMVWEP